MSIIARFLTPKEKLAVLSLLNKSWHRLISKHYAWTALPTRGKECLVSDYIRFFDSFSELGGVAVLDFPGQFLNPTRFKVLETAREITISEFKIDEWISLLNGNPSFLKS